METRENVAHQYFTEIGDKLDYYDNTCEELARRIIEMFPNYRKVTIYPRDNLWLCHRLYTKNLWCYHVVLKDKDGFIHDPWWPEALPKSQYLEEAFEGNPKSRYIED